MLRIDDLADGLPDKGASRKPTYGTKDQYF